MEQGVTRLYWVAAYWELLITGRRCHINVKERR
jgi:hypothetical protein